MRYAFSTAGVLCLPLLASAQHARHGHVAAHDHGLHHRDLEAGVVTATEVVYVTVTVTAPVASTSSTSMSPTTSSDVPSIAAPATGGSSFHELKPVPGSVSVKNSCDYPVYIWSVGHKSCGEGNECQLIAPNSTYTEGMRTCTDGGISLKVSKTKSAEKPMQFEYSVWAIRTTTVSYDISYLDCMVGQKGAKDLSGCAGHDGGIQVVAGDASCPDYHCAANEWCDVQAYVVAEFDYKPGAPVGACAVEKGLAFELCAGT
ncbi:hypothetical protein IAQ61_005418 [Plenodomus lingam]|uniref:Predicted protein n=1 Tax=Leptosphaeria maculans (strain JN3 / isolate v23.1.3 / race Av1-4-5-6-7-8) TaxID=985895 RepID=E4ZZC6_LEPMJ|nr:predicted protein [Plenodomus lingam JN3]KAH9871239.1 hypothetical protein IAQ61_005418 [Plenodomus lingam]CBX96721.1 predicted protein [Plenodomus lingam JN3]